MRLDDFSEDSNVAIGLLFYKIYISDFLLVVCPVADKTVGAVVAADVFLLAAFTPDGRFLISEESLSYFLYAIPAALGHDPFQPIHLPQVP